MPELPEVHTTVQGLRKHIIGLRIIDVWSDYRSPYFKGSETIKDSSYFAYLKKEIKGSIISTIDRRAKNILIYLKPSSHTIKGTHVTRKILLIHMKMTGHLLYGTYRFDPKKKKDPWQPIRPASLVDPFNRHVHFVLSFSNNKQLVLSDVRKFAKVTLIDAQTAHKSDHLKHLGPEPLEKTFTLNAFIERLNLRSHGRIKDVLMDQKIIAGIGNIYADESLWRADIHPLETVSLITPRQLKKLFDAIKKTLTHGIALGGDSTSDYRDVLGERGRFHEGHHAYQKTGSLCDKRGCHGTIKRIVIKGRGTHYCDTHQVYKKGR